VVDDEEGARFALRQLLGSTDEFLCVGDFSSGEEALAGIPGVCPQVVLMDVQMPGMGGVECTCRLRALLSDLKVVMVTAFEDSETLRQSLAAGATHYLVKPFTTIQCRAAIRAAFLNSTNGPQSPMGSATGGENP
jgi:DNA-binding NarL/FixJ family response regulator